MDNKNYEVEDFLENEFFVDWVLHPNSETHHFWISWINGHPEKRQDVELAREIIKSLHYQDSYKLDDKEYSLMMERVFNQKEPNRISTIYKRIIKNSYKIAASVLLILSVAAIFYLTSLEKVAMHNTAQTWTSTSTEYGQKKTISLPDGTKVILNSGSRIEYPQAFHQGQRLVKFEGEGFFEVAHNPKKPFIIESGELRTKVLGTSFNLKSFDQCQEVSVSVVSGKVEIKAETGHTALLKPNEMVVFNKISKDLSRRSFEKEKLLAWTNGTLLFENEDLPTIFNRLERWYGVRFEIQEGVNLQGRYSGEYKRKSLELVLEGLSYTSNFNYKINHKTIMIYEQTP